MKRYVLTCLLLCVALGAAAQGRETYSLNEGWQFFFKSENSSDNARRVTLPHTWNTDARAAGDFLHTTANYQNDFFVPAAWATRRLFVKFYGVQSVADVFVNGAHVGSHGGGGTAFTFEITDKVRLGADNTLLVVVSNTDRTDVLPTSTDINLYGGIYRDAELILTAQTAVSPLWFGSDGVLIRQKSVARDRVEAEAQVYLTAKGETSCTLTLDVTAPDGRIVFSKKQRVRIDADPAIVPFTIDRPQLWSPDSARLYSISVGIGEGTPADAVTVRTGFRRIEATPSGGLTINGVRIPIHGVTLYHDNLLSAGALTPADYDADLRQIDALGANAIRSAVMPHAQYLYDRCDEQGLLAWVEMPLQRASFLGDIAYFATPQFERNGVQQLQEIIAQNYNHPSVAMWGVFSCLWVRDGDLLPYLKRLDDLAHTMDASRPTVACSDQDGNINFITDLIVWRQNIGWNKGQPSDVSIWRDRLQKNWSQLRSGVCYGVPGFIGQADNTVQTAPRPNWLPEARQTRFHEEYAANLSSDSLFWGVWIDQMFDHGAARLPYGVEGSGLVTLDRRGYKDAYYLYKALWNKQQPTLHIADKHDRARLQARQSFTIYSSAGRPTLYIDRDTVAIGEVAPCRYRSEEVVLRAEAEVRAVAGALRDSVRITVGNALRPRRR